MKFKISKKNIFIIGMGIIIVFIAIQFINVEKTNPSITAEIPFPPELKTVMQKSCFDCHSNETSWPWYSNVAPVSWLVSRDVIEGRKELNFSEWNKYTDKKRTKKIKEIWKEVDEGHMPMPIYTFIHRDAILTYDDKELIRTWVNSFDLSEDSTVSLVQLKNELVLN